MDKILEIYADKIIDPIDPMRTELDQQSIFELAASIKREGLINPITVRPILAHSVNECPSPVLDSSGSKTCKCEKYEVVAGHRRFRACLIAGIVKIPCIVSQLSDDQVYEIRAHENLFRLDVDPVDEAIFLGKLVGTDESKIPEIAQRLNRSVQWVNDRLDILTYPDYFIGPLREKRVSLGVCHWLAKITDDVYRKMFFEQAIANGMAVWQAEYYFRQWAAGVYEDSAKVIPPDPTIDKTAPARFSTTCAKCGREATDPNLKAVFIHIECPPDNNPSSP